MSAGGLVGLGLLFIVCGLFIGLLGPIPDQMNHLNNAMIGTGLPMSQDRMDTMGFLQSGFAIMGFMILLAGGFNYWVNSIREQNSEV